jgi:hypothetical protein
VLLEVNWGGDLNLAQLAYGRGVLDAEYRTHLNANGYDPKRAGCDSSICAPDFPAKDIPDN